MIRRKCLKMGEKHIGNLAHDDSAFPDLVGKRLGFE